MQSMTKQERHFSTQNCPTKKPNINPVMRKVYTTIVVKVIMNIDDGVDVADVIGEMDYQFNISEDQGFIEDTEIVDFNVDDSK